MIFVFVLALVLSFVDIHLIMVKDMYHLFNNDLGVRKGEKIKASTELWHQKETADVLVHFLAIV